MARNATSSEQHRRTPTTVAELYLGLDLFTRYAEACGALTDAEGTALLERGWQALGEAAAKQTTFQTGSEPVQRFLDLLSAALAAGKAHVASASGQKPDRPQRWGWRGEGDTCQPHGVRVGWVDLHGLYLEPEAAFSVVQQMAREGGEPLAISSRTLHKRLHEKEALVSIDESRRSPPTKRKDAFDADEEDVEHQSALPQGRIVFLLRLA